MARKALRVSNAYCDGEEAEVTCLKCREKFHSLDRRRNRICPDCAYENKFVMKIPVASVRQDHAVHFKGLGRYCE